MEKSLCTCTCTCTVLGCTSRSVTAAVLAMLMSQRLNSREVTVPKAALARACCYSGCTCVNLKSQRLHSRELAVTTAVLAWIWNHSGCTHVSLLCSGWSRCSCTLCGRSSISGDLDMCSSRPSSRCRCALTGNAGDDILRSIMKFCGSIRSSGTRLSS